jgi:mannose-6-phosphate isomerase-like protein (cupin superfamily)
MTAGPRAGGRVSGSMTAPPFFIPLDGGERIHFAGAELVIRASAETTGGAFSIVEEIDPLDTRLHVHEHEDEVFYVLEGEHRYRVGDQEFVAGPGEMVFAPRGVPHFQRRVVARTGRQLTLTSPAGFEGFFRELGRADAAGTLDVDFARVSERYGITWLE